MSILWREKTNDLLAEVYAEVEKVNEKIFKKELGKSEERGINDE